MNKLFIIGNGFDLAHGLKTSYSDFILWLHKKMVRSVLAELNYDYIDGFRSYKNEFYNATIRFFDYKLSNFKEMFNNLEAYDNLNDFLNNIPIYNNTRVISYNFEDRFIQKLIDNSKNKNWVDIENEYYETIKNLYLSYERNSRNGFSEIEPDILKINSAFSHLKLMLKEYISTISCNTGHNQIQFNIHSNLDNSLDSKTDFMILNFNYTSTVEHYVSSKKVNYIHGNVKDLNSDIIFGYGDEMDHIYSKLEYVNNNHLLAHFKSFGYFQTDNYKKLLNFIKLPYEAIIMGHSCGLSDRILLNTIFENEKCQSIKIYYHQKSSSLNDFFHKTQEISRHFKDKASMREKIVPFDKSYPLVNCN